MKDLPSPLQAVVQSPEQRRAFLQQLHALLPAEQFQQVETITHWIGELLQQMEQKNLSLERLRTLLFGGSSEKSRKIQGDKEDKGVKEDKGDKGDKTDEKPSKPEKCRGHGRRSHRDYRGARRFPVSHRDLKAGQTCCGCGKGKLRRQKAPAVTITVTAQPSIGATAYEMERLRCDACGTVYTAVLPGDDGLEKYAPNVGVMVGLMRYGAGMPFHRLARLQASVGVPLPASIQWEQVRRTADALEPVMNHLIYLGAQASIVYTDDTTMRVRTLRQEIEAEKEPERTGIFTTGMVCDTGDNRIQLFFTGRKHAGENLSQVLDKRAPGLTPPLHMSDALACNTAKGHTTRSCKCAVHARRNFVEIRGSFPEECNKVVDTFAVVYRVEAQCREEAVDAEERLKRHQAESGPELARLKAWFDEQITQKKVEPNSGLGQAISYMRERWSELTRFLETPGAPIDNNITERLLKTSILHRKNSLHYRTQRGAEVGDIFMSIIQTCAAQKVNPAEYMEALVKNQEAVKAHPELWLPWNYHETLAGAKN